MKQLLRVGLSPLPLRLTHHHQLFSLCVVFCISPSCLTLLIQSRQELLVARAKGDVLQSVGWRLYAVEWSGSGATYKTDATRLESVALLSQLRLKLTDPLCLSP